jgi:hypothetical protein
MVLVIIWTSFIITMSFGALGGKINTSLYLIYGFVTLYFIYINKLVKLAWEH